MFKSSLYIYFTIILLVGCSDNDSEENDFECSVDFVEFKTNNIASVKFDVELEGIKDSYFVEQAYTQDGSDFFIGNNLVSIKSFTAKGNEATFTFEYGENLGPFCVELFSAIPMHTHDTFEADAERVVTGKGIGKWQIKRKRVIKEND